MVKETKEWKRFPLSKNFEREWAITFNISACGLSLMLCIFCKNLCKKGNFIQSTFHQHNIIRSFSKNVRASCIPRAPMHLLFVSRLLMVSMHQGLDFSFEGNNVEYRETLRIMIIVRMSMNFFFLCDQILVGFSIHDFQSKSHPNIFSRMTVKPQIYRTVFIFFFTFVCLWYISLV